MSKTYTRAELLQKYIDMEGHNLYCFSCNYLMSKPKPGMQAAWEEAKARLKALEALRDSEEKAAPTGVVINMERIAKNATSIARDLIEQQAIKELVDRFGLPIQINGEIAQP